MAKRKPRSVKETSKNQIVSSTTLYMLESQEMLLL